ncbi:NYN domain-containing protein [uncultured Senegalimassilia sp.]|uniref:NYN domain-containing protein n=1 Tax=uncultured Senegalimassilia sp. TaxID=1714350 RepID=UPI00258686AC|nr:NYN domain-containing protein [uncultured Senegalimassilia sp.]
MDSKPSEKRFALIIDADNVSAKYIKPITDELSKYGTITYKRIYGDWTSTLHAKWKDALLENSITPIQQFSYTTGKNATDSAMIIDAMDIMYTNSVEGFCIVSSDSDFTRLASRIRESGLTVIGMGEKKTPTPFRKACDIFTTLELLVGEDGKQSGRRGHRGQAAGAGQGSGPAVEQIERAVVDIVTDNQNNGKATGLGEVGSRLLKRYPDFDVRSYGTNQLTKLLGEFVSVQVIKDGSSVMVELTEVVSVGAEVADTADGKANLQQDTAKNQENEKPKRSRRGRSRRGRAKSAAAETPEQDQQAAVNQGVASEAAAAEQDAPDGEAELASTSRAQIAPAQDAPELQDAPASIEPAQQTAPVQAEPAQTPESVVFDAVRNAGAEGVSVAELTKRVRATFKDFKVRDRGFSQMRQFVASLGDIKVEKRGSVYFATLEE